MIHNNQTNRQGRYIRSLSVHKVALCGLFLLPFFWSACSSDDEDLPEPLPSPSQQESPIEATIGSDAVNFPIAGTLRSQYADSPSGSDIGKIADRDPDTQFITYHDKFYILFEGEDETVINYYTLTSASDIPEADPKSWSLYGSADNLSWIRLDRQQNQVFAKRGEEKSYQCYNTVAYRYYKLEIESNGGDYSTQIAEFMLKNVAAEVTYWNIYMPAAGTLSPQYADFPQGTEINNVIDNEYETEFVVPHNHFYLLWSGNEQAIACHYSLVSASDSPEKDPKSWVLSASNDGDTWVTIDEKSDQVFTQRGEKKDFALENKEQYLYYRLEITENAGADVTQIAEWHLQGYVDITKLLERSEGTTASLITPMGKHFENRTVTTDEIREWLRVASNEPTITDGDGRFQWVEQPVILYPFGKPLPADIHQRGIGDCCAVASLASMAYMYPDFIQSIIRDNGDKTYTIDMYDPMGEPIEVSVTSKFLSNENGDDFGSCGKNEVCNWGTILEKAIMKYRHIYWGNYSLGGIPQQETNPLFTGKGDLVYCYGPGRLTNEELTKLVRAGLAQGYFVTGGFNKALPIGNQATVTGHCFSGMYSADPYALFSMRNPWGGDGEKDGVLNIPNDNIIPPTVDIMLMHAGSIQDNGGGVFEAYVPPVW